MTLLWARLLDFTMARLVRGGGGALGLCVAGENLACGFAKELALHAWAMWLK